MSDDTILPFRQPAPEPELLERYLAGECSDAEIARVRAWAGTSDTGAAYADQLRDAYRALDPQPVDVTALRRTLRQRIERAPSRVRNRTSHAARGHAASVAVGLAAVLGMTGVAARYFSSRTTERSPKTYATAAGLRATVMLADGTRAVLGPSTTLTVRASSSGARVDANVVGQALFTVAHHHQRVFRVQAGHAIAHVLGTTFFVRHYAVDATSRVVVSDGRVAVRSAANLTHPKETILTAGAMATVNDAGRMQVVAHVPLDSYTAWTRGELVFHDTPVRDAMLELSRAYDVDIRIADSTLATRSISATIVVTRQSLSTVLELLTDVLDAHIVRVGPTLTLTPGRSAPRRLKGSNPSFTPESRYGR